jgi:hypothetical protein
MLMNKKADTPKQDPRALLGNLVARNAEHPKSPIQEVRPIGDSRDAGGERPSKMGRPSRKVKGGEYVKIGPKIPRALKKEMDIALVNERFDGVVTIDEFVAEALRRMLET